MLQDLRKKRTDDGVQLFGRIHIIQIFATVRIRHIAVHIRNVIVRQQLRKREDPVAYIREPLAQEMRMVVGHAEHEVLAVEPLPEAVDAWAYPYRFPVALIFGNEALGISPEALEAADAAVGLPMFGEKASINVGNCAAVVLYAAAAKYLADPRS